MDHTKSRRCALIWEASTSLTSCRTCSTSSASSEIPRPPTRRKKTLAPRQSTRPSLQGLEPSSLTAVLSSAGGEKQFTPSFTLTIARRTLPSKTACHSLSCMVARHRMIIFARSDVVYTSTFRVKEGRSSTRRLSLASSSDTASANGTTASSILVSH